MDMASAETPLLAYYRKRGLDAQERSIDEVRAYGRREFDMTHDFIQWLFPLTERSAAVPDSPVLTNTDIAAFLGDVTLRRELVNSLNCLLAFLGLELSERSGYPAVIPGSDFAACSQVWLTPGNHNLRRLSRALRSLVVLGCPDHARALFTCLDSLRRGHADTINNEVYGFWQRAIGS